MLRSWWILLCVAPSFLLSCGSPDGLVVPSEEASEGTALFPADNDAQHVAVALAAALGERMVAAGLKDALRASPFNEHKLVLQEYLATSEGALLLSRTANVAQMTTEEFTHTVGRLPDMDFYMPFDEHRLSWRGDPSILVAVIEDPDAHSVQAFDHHGRSVIVNSFQARSSQRPLLILHPAEPKTRRVEVRQTAGGTIQDEDESTDTEIVVIFERGASRGMTPHAMCDGEDCSGGGSGTLPLQFTVSEFIIYHHFEGPFMGDMEIEILYQNTNDEIYKVRKTGVDADRIYAIQKGVYSDFPFNFQFVMRETDFPSPDDFIGEGILFTNSIVCIDISGPSDCNASVSHIFP